MNIAFDVDGVLTDFQSFLDIYGRRYLSKKYNKDIQVVAYSGEFRERFNCKKKDNVFFYLKYLYWYALKYPAREYVTESIKKLQDNGNKVYIITARAFSQKKNIFGKLMRMCLVGWLKKNDISYDGLYYVKDDKAPEQKAELAKKLKIDYFVEDTQKNIEAINKSCKTICIAADYNYNVKNSIRVKDFNEMLDCLLENS